MEIYVPKSLYSSKLILFGFAPWHLRLKQKDFEVWECSCHRPCSSFVCPLLTDPQKIPDLGAGTKQFQPSISVKWFMQYVHVLYLLYSEFMNVNEEYE
jgi:hypothetical protein